MCVCVCVCVCVCWFIDHLYFCNNQPSTGIRTETRVACSTTPQAIVHRLIEMRLLVHREQSLILRDGIN